MSRTGEKWGWIGGWLGSFIWILISSIVWLWQGKYLFAALGGGSFLMALALIFLLAPWKHPTMAYWKLMLPLLTLFVVSAVVFVLVSGGLQEPGNFSWSILFLAFLLLPLLNTGKRRWDDEYPK
ncbi:hypothetical protein [Desulfomonile tiedjei]|uniref:Uncharacterized protein n=1 Tax=Desulfomonile tiedjei (strain ATCC 49306 / DSM 6799 / DCB-1) TaxID=706587 RepID=I4C2H4_DESTA|nr:hypothetical protein [Desulfomonile tiedjei]AFM23765.1 hypothetical protein Desti_1049 [Desulfomonile tiedjei DSM 6799]